MHQGRPEHHRLAGARQSPVPLELSRDYAYEERPLLEAGRGAKVVLLASPNNPTGSVLSRGTVEELLAKTDALIVIDEAQNLSDAVLEMVRLLTNFETPSAKLTPVQIRDP